MQRAQSKDPYTSPLTIEVLRLGLKSSLRMTVVWVLPVVWVLLAKSEQRIAKSVHPAQSKEPYTSLLTIEVLRLGLKSSLRMTVVWVLPVVWVLLAKSEQRIAKSVHPAQSKEPYTSLLTIEVLRLGLKSSLRMTVVWVLPVVWVLLAKSEQRIAKSVHPAQSKEPYTSPLTIEVLRLGLKSSLRMTK